MIILEATAGTITPSSTRRIFSAVHSPAPGVKVEVGGVKVGISSIEIGRDLVIVLITIIVIATITAIIATTEETAGAIVIAVPTGTVAAATIVPNYRSAVATVKPSPITKSWMRRPTKNWVGSTTIRAGTIPRNASRKRHRRAVRAETRNPSIQRRRSFGRI